MTITRGPNVALPVNGAVGENHYAELMRMWRLLDGLLQAKVLGMMASLPLNPSDGDTYIAADKTWNRWSQTQGAWETLTPKAGWLVVYAGEPWVYSGSAWQRVPVASTQISDSTAVGRAILTAATATAQRTALGLGSAALVDDATIAHRVNTEVIAGQKTFTNAVTYFGPETAVSGAGGSIAFRNDTGTSRFQIGHLGAGATSLLIYDQITGAIRMEITATGDTRFYNTVDSAWGVSLRNYSAGVAADTRFTLQDDAGTSVMQAIVYSTAHTGGPIMGQSRTACAFFFSGARHLVVGTTAAKDLYLATNNLTRATISSAGVFTVHANVASTSSTTGAFVVTYGVGIGGDLNVGGYIAGPKVRLTVEGGIAVKLTNKTGATSVKGYAVRVYSATAVDNAVGLTIDTAPDCCGVVYEAGIADGSEMWVVISGIAEVYFIGSTTRGHLARTFLAAEAGYVSGQALSEAVPSPPFDTDKHFCEIGHVLASRTGAGLAKVALHFN